MKYLSKGELIAILLVFIFACIAIYFAQGYVIDTVGDKRDAKKRNNPCSDCEEKKKNFIPVEFPDEIDSEG